MNRKVVLVTGSTRGIGEEAIRKFASNNYDCVITYLNNEIKAKELKNELETKYEIKCITVKCDISNDNDVTNLYNEVFKTFGKIDVLVNNAGIAMDTLFELKNKEDFMKTLETNLYGTFSVSRKFGDLMYKNESGVIINISSTNGIDSYYEFSVDYDASKAGVINLTHNLANHYAPYVRVNAVCPGWVNTPMNKEMTDEFKNEEIKKILINRFAEPNEIANLIYFLSTNDASYINDSIIKIDGGRRV